MPTALAPENHGIQMTYVKRLLDLSFPLKTRSVFVFGPRQTGKSTFLKHQLPKPAGFTFNLIDQKTFLELSADPTRMRQRVLAKKPANCLVVIDEIQKLPAPLNEVQLLIEDFDIRFVLTGSSARKLEKNKVNLLGGSGRDPSLHPSGMECLNLFFDYASGK